MSEVKERPFDIVDTGKRKALIISVSDYIDNKLQPLDFCRKDGEQMHEVLKGLGYEIADGRKLIGHVEFVAMRDAIYDFFDNNQTAANDTLLFYYSGHGIPISDGNMCLASSETNTNAPKKRGFTSYELTTLIQDSNSIRIVEILDCCYSGANKLGKGGNEEAAAKLGREVIESNKRILLQGEGKCILAASQAAQEAFGLKEKEHSIFTYYLLEGLKGHEKSVDADGNVTPYSLGKYVYKAILNLPPKKRPIQKPVTKTEGSGEIILAYYPQFAEIRYIPSHTKDTSWIIEQGIQCLKDEKYSDAIRLFDKAITSNPNSFTAYNCKGYAFFKLGKLEEASRCFDSGRNVAANSKEDKPIPNRRNLSLDLVEGFGRSIYEGRCLPFIGPGTSIFQNKEGKQCPPPIWHALERLVTQDRDYAWYEITNQITKQQDFSTDLLAHLSQSLALQEQDQLFPKLSVSDLIKKIDVPDFSLEDLKNAPYAILADLDLPLYITTNYDHFMEKALECKGKKPISDFCRWNEKLMKYARPEYIGRHRFDSSQPLVYHFYGDSEMPESMVLTETDYKDFVMNLSKEDRVLPPPIRMGLVLSSIFFIGYSLQDVDFSTLIEGVMREFRKNEAKVYPWQERLPVTVQLPPSASNIEEKARVMRHLEKRAENIFGINLWWGEISDFLTQLSEARNKLKKARA